jgi:hypothetical protein
MVLSCVSIASHDWAIAAAGESLPESIRRWSSASEIMRFFPAASGSLFMDRRVLASEDGTGKTG